MNKSAKYQRYCEFHIFEHERTPFVAKKLEQLQEGGQELERIARLSADAEYQYELKADPLEKALVTEGAAIAEDLEHWFDYDMVDKAMSKSQYLSFVSRINQFSKGIDDLLNMEIKAQVDFTGSGPASR